MNAKLPLDVVARVARGPRSAPGAHGAGAHPAALIAGRNCWRIEHSPRVAFLVDGEAFFGAVRAAIAKARHSVFIVGWDIDSRMQLAAGGNDGLPAPLGEFLNALVEARKALHGYVLSWDFAMLYAIEREWLPIYKLDWLTHRRLSFRLDDHHPTGASHHQKIVVVDDAVAFVSGYDLTRSRWDTSAHTPGDPRRVDHRGVPYGPFHDVGMMVAGDCARALGALARERWRRATGTRVPRRPAAAFDRVWPEDVEPAATDVDVAIARTEPAFDGRAGVREVRALYLDAIAQARRHIFIENQYFTSRTIADAFARRLREDDTRPEIALLSPYTQSGWLESATMGVLRARLHRELQAADRNGRYRMYCPTLAEPDTSDGCLNVHSKVMIVDDALLIVGSANLADRSLGLDTECNLALEARGDPRLARAIAGLRERLLAEHLASGPAQVAHATATRGGLHAAVSALAQPSGRRLIAFDPPLDPGLDAMIPDHKVIDPEQPLEADAIVADLLPQPEARSVARVRLIVAALAIVALAGMALAWRYTPLSNWLALERLVELGRALGEHRWAPAWMMLVYIAGGLVVFPVLLLIAATGIVFGPLLGPVYALLGSTASAAVTFAIGRHLGRETVRTVAGPRINELSQRLAQHGLLAVVFVRMLPVAPFSVVNIVAGASHIGWRHFVLGTLLGLLPGVVSMTLFVDRAVAVVRDPGMDTFLLLAFAVVAIVAFIRLLRSKVRARAEQPNPPPLQSNHGS